MTRHCVIKGGYGLGNFGDDALMYWAVSVVKTQLKDAVVILECKPASYIGRFVDVSFDLRLANENVVYVYGGGTLFYNFPRNNRSKFALVIEALKNPGKLARKLQILSAHKISKNAVKKTIMIGAGFGPFYSEKSSGYRGALAAIGTANSVVVRDSSAYEFASAFNENTSLGADLCFATVDGIEELNNNFSKVEKVAFILRDWDVGTDADVYFEKTYQAALLLRSRGVAVEFVSFSALSDMDTNRVLANLQEQVRVWNPNEDTINGFMKYLSQFSVIISSRFHGLVFATLLKVPSIAVVIENKLRVATENSACSLWDPVSDEAADLVCLVDHISDSYDQCRASCSELAFNNRQRVDAVLREVFEDARI